MTARSVVDLVGCLEEAGIRVWLDGGWAVDAASGSQTRPHDDLDLVVELCNVALQGILKERGYTVVGGEAPKSFEMIDADGRQVDVHPVEFSRSGDGDLPHGQRRELGLPGGRFRRHGPRCRPARALPDA